jgi:trans-aconitate 2-methyltransferase
MVSHLETDRLLLRRLTPDDAGALFRTAGDPAVMRYWFPGPDRDVCQTLERIAQIDDHWRDYGFGDWAAVSKPEGRVIGFSGLHHITDMAEVNIGYALEQGWWRRGLGREVCRLVLAHGFDRLGLSQIVAVIDPRNAASIALVESCGFALWKQLCWMGKERVAYRITATARTPDKRHNPVAHEFDGRRYAQASAHQKQWGASLIADLRLQGSERVLDLGCGDGALTAQIADLLPTGEVVGIDASRGMIAATRANERPNARFLLADIADFELGQRFDVIFSNAVLHWVKDHRRLYRHVVRALGDGGRVRFNFAGEGNCSHFFAVAREAMAHPEFAASFAAFEWPWYMPSVDEYSALVAAAGLREPRVWGENADRFFPDVDTMIAWVDQPSLVPFLAHLPNELKPAFRDYVVARMVEETRRADGTCFETFRRVNVAAPAQEAR